MMRKHSLRKFKWDKRFSLYLALPALLALILPAPLSAGSAAPGISGKYTRQAQLTIMKPGSQRPGTHRPNTHSNPSDSFKPTIKPCPRGTIGVWPLCTKIVKRKCPSGTVGRWPKCKKVVKKICPSGTKGYWPKCYKVAEPKSPCKTKDCGKRKKSVRTPIQPRSSGRTLAAASPQNRRPNELVVILNRDADQSFEAAIAQQYRLVALGGDTNELLQARIQRYRIPDRRTVEQVLAALQGDNRIRSAQPNFLYYVRGEKNGSKHKNESKNEISAMQYAADRLHLVPAHALAEGRHINIAVIDSGVDIGHPELGGAVGASFDAVTKSSKISETDEHGTSIAGIIAARKELVGVAPGAELFAIRAFFKEKDSGPLTTTFILLRAIDWANDRKAGVFNLSFTGPKDPAIEEVLTKITSRGGIVVAAAGNDGPKAPAAFPAAYPNVIAVTAIDEIGRLYKKANRGKHIAVAAPGVLVFAPVPEGGYDFQTGTSFASAHVSGLVALLLERDPSMKPAQIRALLSKTAEDMGPPGADSLYGAGLVDVLTAFKQIKPQNKRQPLAVSTTD